MWNNETIKEFWQHNQADFSADTNAKLIIKLTRKYINGKVLDIGAGSGALINLIPDSVGLDIVPRHPKVVEGSIDKIPFGDCLFDTIYCTDVLEHLTYETIEKGIKEIYRVLKKDGKLIIVSPFEEDLKQSFVYCPNCKIEFHRWGHLHSFDELDMDLLFSLSLFKIIKKKFIPLGMMSYHWIIRYFWRWFIMFKFFRISHMIVVVKKL